MSTRASFVVIVCVCAAHSICHADFTIVREGKPVAVIVSDSPVEAVDAPPAKGKRKKGVIDNVEGKAASLLVQWIAKMTDARLSAVTETPAGIPAIYIGKAAEKAGLKLDDIDSPSREGIRIIADDKRILIGGQSDGATYKAVCRFLEELGCRYFMDGPLGEVYPRSTTLTVKSLSITEKPGMNGRHPKGPSWGDASWRMWNGDGGEMIHHQHSWGHYCAEQEFDKHPEWFAMGADGQRHAGGWICTSNPELRKHFAQEVIKSIEAGEKHPSISPTDGRGYCQCPACKAQDDPKLLEPSTGTVAITNRYVDFFDDVAREVAKVHPESVLSFICYADYTQPPTIKKKLSPNLCAVIAPIRYCRLHAIGDAHCPSRLQQLEMIDGWSQVASRLGYYNYMYNLADGTLPMFKFSALKKEFPYLQSRGVSFMTIEVLSNWQIYGPQIYLSLRLAYDPKADADAIMEDYWQKFFGPAAGPFMKAYWMGIDEQMQKLESHAGSFYGLAQIYTPEFLTKCEGLLASAAAAAKGNEMYEKRVALHAEGLKSAIQYRQISDASIRGEFALAAKTLDEMADRLGALGKQRLANPEYAGAYVHRFMERNIHAAASAASPPNKVLQVLPDKWRFAVDEADEGNQKNYHARDFDDSKWATVATYSQTLDEQGFDRTSVLWYRTTFSVPAQHARLAMFFTEIDGQTEVYVNGSKIPVVLPAPAVKRSKKDAAAPAAKPATPTPAGREGQSKPRAAFEVDITDAVKLGENVLSLRVDHTKITDLSLGGILRPVALIEKP